MRGEEEDERANAGRDTTKPVSLDQTLRSEERGQASKNLLSAQLTTYRIGRLTPLMPSLLNVRNAQTNIHAKWTLIFETRAKGFSPYRTIISIQH